MHPAERAEIEAMQDLYSAAPADVAARHGIGVAKVGGAICLSVGALADVTLFNRAVGLGVEREATDEDILAVTRHFTGLGTCAFVTVDREARPPDLAGRLERRGFVEGYGWEKFVRLPDPGAVSASDLRVQRIDTARTEDFARVVVGGYGFPAFLGEWLGALVGRPGWHCYLAYDGRTPAGCATLHATGELGWLGLGAVLPEFRGRGAQGALLAARIRDGARLGLTTLVTETGVVEEGRPSFSHRNIVRSGFGAVYVRPNYVSPPG